MAQASFYCPNCNTMRLFTAQEMNHTPHILASIFLCGLWLPIWLIMAATENPRYHCSQCGYSDDVKYLANPNLREQERLRQQAFQERVATGESIPVSERIKYLSPGAIAAIIVVGLILLCSISSLISSNTGNNVANKNANSITSFSSNSNSTEPTDAEILQSVKDYLRNNKGKMGDSGYYAIYKNLIKIQPNTDAYPEAQSILKQYKKEIDKAKRNIK